MFNYAPGEYAALYLDDIVFADEKLRDIQEKDILTGDGWQHEARPKPKKIKALKIKRNFTRRELAYA